MSDLTGQSLQGYEFLEQIGSGGSGAVYRAAEAAVDRQVAIKVILPQYAADPEFKQRFATEARLVARLEHPHIVPLYNYWQDEHGAFLVMRYVAGGSLRALLKRQGALALTQIERILAQIAEALAVAHAAGVVHRDLKPDNILLDERGNAYLTDFGIAKQINQPDNLTAAGDVVGTLRYLSPEQIREQPVSAQTDIYALGIMLYEMLCGEHPFKAQAGSMAVVDKHLNDPLPSVLNVRPDLPTRLDAVIQQATAKEPNARHASATALVADLRVALKPDTDVEVVTQVSQIAPSPLQRLLPKPTPQIDRNRRAMLDNVRAFWVAGVLEQSLYNAVRVELGMSEIPEAVENPWQTVLKMPDEPDETLPTGTTISDIFDRLRGKMLILGDPGSGKTTTMLTLARDLLDRAEADSAHPLPVVFNLSSWADRRKSLIAWMADELNQKYQVPRKLARRWLDDEQILPLLDGLDEVAPDYRDACVEAINTFRDDHGFVDVVVCSRSADYEALNNKLRLNGAIMLQPLTREQVDAYIAQAGEGLLAVRQVLEDDEKLRRLTTSPLMLNILTMAYRDLTIDEIAQFDTLEGRRKHVFATYVDRMLERRGTHRRYTPEQTRHYLMWLAHYMSERAESVFQIDGLQIDALQTPTLRLRYEIMQRLAVFGLILIALALNTLIRNALGGTDILKTAQRILVDATWLDASMLLVFLAASQRIAKLPTWITTLLLGTLGSILPILYILNMYGVDSQLSRSEYLNIIYAMIVFFTLKLAFPIAFIGALVAGSSEIRNNRRLGWSEESFNRGFFRALAPAITIVTLALSVMIVFGFVSPLDDTDVTGSLAVSTLIILIPLSMTLLVGGTGVIFQLVPRLKSSHSKKMLMIATAPLIWGLLIALPLVVMLARSADALDMQFTELFHAFSLGIVLFGLLLAFMGAIPVLILATIGGILQGIFVENVESEVKPNQGTWRSARIAVTVGIILSVVFSVVLTSYFRARTDLPPSATTTLGVAAGLALALALGGLAAIRHVVLRAILTRSGATPWNLRHFLDYAQDHILLRRVGSGYVFIHRMLLEFFANQHDETEPDDDSEQVSYFEDDDYAYRLADEDAPSTEKLKHGA